jgi:DNA-damage-inducible protein J
MDTEIKRELEAVCRELGLNISTAFNVFARKVARERRIPFELDLDPFYSESNTTHLLRIKQDAEAGRHMSDHELIDD